MVSRGKSLEDSLALVSGPGAREPESLRIKCQKPHQRLSIMENVSAGSALACYVLLGCLEFSFNLRTLSAWLLDYTGGCNSYTLLMAENMIIYGNENSSLLIGWKQPINRVLLIDSTVAYFPYWLHKGTVHWDNPVCCQKPQSLVPLQPLLSLVRWTLLHVSWSITHFLLGVGFQGRRASGTLSSETGRVKKKQFPVLSTLLSFSLPEICSHAWASASICR